MDVEQLVQMITKEVMNRVKQIETPEELSPQKTVKILIAESSRSGIYEELANSLEKANYCYDSLESMENDLDVYESIVFGEMDNRSLANISLGVQCLPKEVIAIEAALLGKKIILLEDGLKYQKYKSTSNKALYSLYQNYENKLVSYGMEIVSKNDFMKVLKSNKQKNCDSVQDNVIKVEPVISAQSVKEVESYDFSEKRVLSEADLKRVYRNGIRKIKISNKTLLTPLVKDFIRNNKITVTKSV
ncbi:hypothetical protein SH2C18_26640 [Clostridium sediminicola]|uniref:hypothetical protein n=1 Tax=Clostridium sediminicola TaxID=3114879 RepID=UPI0031F262BB